MKTARQARRDAKRLFRMCLVNGLLDEGRTRLVVQRIAEARRRGGLLLLSHFQRFVELECARRTARIESAVPLSDELRTNIQAGLTHSYGPGVSTAFVQNPALIGGMRIKVGSDVYDGSVLGRLAALGDSF